MTSPARSLIVPVESRDGPSREAREALFFEFRLTTPLGFSVGEIGVVVVVVVDAVVLESGEGRDDGDERDLVVEVVVEVFGSIAKEEGAEAVVEEEELGLVCRFRGWETSQGICWNVSSAMMFFFFFFLVLRDRGGSSYTAVDLTDPFGILNIG